MHSLPQAKPGHCEFPDTGETRCPEVAAFGAVGLSRTVYARYCVKHAEQLKPLWDKYRLYNRLVDC